MYNIIMPYLSKGKQRPVFVYGHLTALPLLTQFLTGNAADIDKVARMVHIATVVGYRRVGIKTSPDAAVIEDAGSTVRGLVVLPESMEHRLQIDDNHDAWDRRVKCILYRMVRVRAYLNFESDVIDADMFLWNGTLQALTMKPWDLKNYMAKEMPSMINELIMAEASS
ncbi:hypothetical protein CMQ_933 [Grosmannia clavigera kw1407]|uniref:Uncharacterized protein n=1 Tax=Grosmannia clavigera (strain kw1407 / UAMH 11150) TaxID=655863 RepID=F0XE60_GROCL|nr:uncharacterized protein CMQ_933 [Grosmannia clavigera kw1407]EFX04005.1 hypothetical protein CMQ_933 [Grosmannia clavigera kw1407]